MRADCSSPQELKCLFVACKDGNYEMMLRSDESAGDHFCVEEMEVTIFKTTIV